MKNLEIFTVKLNLTQSAATAGTIAAWHSYVHKIIALYRCDIYVFCLKGHILNLADQGMRFQTELWLFEKW